MKIINLLFALLFAAFFCPAGVFAQKYSVYNGGISFTASELAMMKDCDPSGCASRKSFNPVTNPTGVPVLSDAIDANNKCYEMVFPRCQFSNSDNYCMKSMSYPKGQVQLPIGSFIWHAFSIYVPTDFDHNPDWSLVYQLHDHPDNVDVCDTWQSPSFAIEISRGSWVFVGRYNAQKCDYGGRSLGAFRKTQAIVKGGWTHFVIHIKFDFAGAGRCEVWQKDAQLLTPVKVADYSGPLGLNDDKMPYDFATFGYYYGDTDTGTGIVKFYFDRIIFGGAGETLAGMMYPLAGTGMEGHKAKGLLLNAARPPGIFPSVYSGLGNVTVELGLPAEDAPTGRVIIVDLGGRVRANLPAAPSIQWNGRGKDGFPLAAGIYLVQWKNGKGLSLQKRMTVIR